MRGWLPETDGRTSLLWFDLKLTDFYAPWHGKLIVHWPPPERSWWRRAHQNEMTVAAILQDSGLGATMPEWNEIEFTWADLRVLMIETNADPVSSWS